MTECKYCGADMTRSPCCGRVDGLAVRAEKAEMELAKVRDTIVPVSISCPSCGQPHVDKGEWATKPHRTHLCERCGGTWRPYPVATCGV